MRAPPVKPGMETRKAQLAATLAVLCGIGACATTGPAPPPDFDMAEIRRLMGCDSDQAPVCTERMGKPYECFCADRDALRRILEPDKY